MAMKYTKTFQKGGEGKTLKEFTCQRAFNFLCEMSILQNFVEQNPFLLTFQCKLSTTFYKQCSGGVFKDFHYTKPLLKITRGDFLKRPCFQTCLALKPWLLPAFKKQSWTKKFSICVLYTLPAFLNKEEHNVWGQSSFLTCHVVSHQR